LIHRHLLIRSPCTNCKHSALGIVAGREQLHLTARADYWETYAIEPLYFSQFTQKLRAGQNLSGGVDVQGAHHAKPFAVFTPDAVRYAVVLDQGAEFFGADWFEYAQFIFIDPHSDCVGVKAVNILWREDLS